MVHSDGSHPCLAGPVVHGQIPSLGEDAEGEVKAISMIMAKLEDGKNKQDAGKMDEAQTEMILCVDDGQLSHMRS